MKKTLLNLATFAIATILLFSCRKNDTLQTPSEDFEKLVTEKQSPIQVFSVSGATGGTITGASGSKITFPPNFARNPDGSAFIGTVTIALQESLKKSQWMFDDLSTTTSGSLLETGGMLNIRATRADNGADLEPSTAMQVPTTPANLNNVIRAEVPRANTGLGGAQMSLFLPDSATPRNTPPTNWVEAPQFGFVNNANNYTFQIPKFSWINCDKFYSYTGPKTTLTVTPVLTGITGVSQVRCMLVFKASSMVLSMSQSGSNFTTPNIPVSSQVDIVYIAKASDGKIVFKVIANNTVTASQNVSITPEIATSAQVNAYLNTL